MSDTRNDLIRYTHLLDRLTLDFRAYLHHEQWDPTILKTKSESISRLSAEISDKVFELRKQIHRL